MTLQEVLCRLLEWLMLEAEQPCAFRTDVNYSAGCNTTTLEPKNYCGPCRVKYILTKPIADTYDEKAAKAGFTSTKIGGIQAFTRPAIPVKKLPDPE